jgi:ubiquitin conjugation factor E4 B
MSTQSYFCVNYNGAISQFPLLSTRKQLVINKMSNFLPDLANWALRGAVAEENENATTEAPLTPEEMRAQRLARMEALSNNHPMQVETSANASPAPSSQKKNETTAPVANVKSPPVPTAVTAASKTPSPTVSAPSSQQKKKPKPEPMDSTKKQQRKIELLLKKVLGIAASDMLDSDEVTVDNIAFILATRLSSYTSSKSLLSYLAASHRKATDELNSSNSSSTPADEILVELQKQLVSYAASCLLDPDIFETASKDSVQQLANCVLTDITFATSFYMLLVDELRNQDATALTTIVQAIATMFYEQLLQLDTLLDTDAVLLVSALQALAAHKQAAHAIAHMDSFLLPAANTPQAKELVRRPGGTFFQMVSYKKRSGPGLERHTLLGACLRLSMPKNNPAFAPGTILQQSVHAVETATMQQRNQLRNHKGACAQLVWTLIKAGPAPRAQVMRWFVDALLVNQGADALRPDLTKVSSSGTLLNISYVLLKLCEPFVDKDSKISLIDPGFVSSPNDHGGVFETAGDTAVARLGETVDGMDTYQPKNAFMPFCFFVCARSLHYGIAPALSAHESLSRHIGHLHYEISDAGRDIRSDPNFAILLCRQRSAEVALFEPEPITDTLRFCNFLAHVLHDMTDENLRTMPEDFVSDVCRIIMSIVKMKDKLMVGANLSYVFKLVVKLLSSKYSALVRNYNLRASLGDVLYDLFLPPAPGDRHKSVPASVYTDLTAGGQTYLLSDPLAQESLAPSLLLLYGEVEHTGYYDKMSHRSKIASLIKFLWESSEHRPAFCRITQNKTSFIKFANGIINETNLLIATVMEKLPKIRTTQELMKNATEWGALTEDDQAQKSSRLDEDEREVKYALPLCNKTLQMFGYLNTDVDIRSLFLLDELCARLVGMLLHVLTKLVGSKGLDLKVENPEQYEFRPKEMLRDLCAIFALFSSTVVFQEECAKSGCDPSLLLSAVKTCKRYNLLTGESMTAFEALPALVERASTRVNADEDLYADAPDEFLDALMATFMKDPVVLPSGNYVDRSTIKQHMLNNPIDPFNRVAMTLDDIKPATELKAKMDNWLAERRASRMRD